MGARGEVCFKGKQWPHIFSGSQQDTSGPSRAIGKPRPCMHALHAPGSVIPSAFTKRQMGRTLCPFPSPGDGGPHS